MIFYLLVLGDGLLLRQSLPLLQTPQVSPPLQPNRGDQPLNLGSLGVRLRTLLLSSNLPPDHKLPDVILFAQIEKLPDLGGTFGTQSFRQNGIGQPWDLGISLFDNDDGQDGDVGVDDTSSNGFSLSFTGSTSSVTRVTGGKEESGSLREKDTLFHGET